MESTKGKKGKSRLRIVESDSDSADDVNELSMSMQHVQLDDEDASKEEESVLENGQDREQIAATRRKPPRGRNLPRLEDFQWSSSDEETEGSFSTSYLSNIEKTSGAKTSSKKMISIRKKSKLTKADILCDSDVSVSDSSLWSSSSSEGDSSAVVSTKSITRNSKKQLSWSFNKNRFEYTICGSDKLPAFSIPSDLYDQLYDFQKDGVAWMAGLHLSKVGGILGDDMGMVRLIRRYGKPSSIFNTNEYFSNCFV